MAIGVPLLHTGQAFFFIHEDSYTVTIPLIQIPATISNFRRNQEKEWRDLGHEKWGTLNIIQRAKYHPRSTSLSYGKESHRTTGATGRESNAAGKARPGHRGVRWRTEFGQEQERWEPRQMGGRNREEGGRGRESSAAGEQRKRKRDAPAGQPSDGGPCLSFPPRGPASRQSLVSAHSSLTARVSVALLLPLADAQGAPVLVEEYLLVAWQRCSVQP